MPTVAYRCSICSEKLRPEDIAVHLEWHSRNESGVPDWPVQIAFGRVLIREDRPEDVAP